MYSSKIKLVQGDTLPRMFLSITDTNSGSSIDLSVAGLSVILFFRQIGDPANTLQIPCALVPGIVDLDAGTVSYASPYTIAGSGGCALSSAWPVGALAKPGNYEGEVQITFPDGTKQTTYDKLRFNVRSF